MKTKLVPFDIEKAKAGAKVVTSGKGYPVEILTYTVSNRFPIAGVVREGKDNFSLEAWTNEGKWAEGDSGLDLMLLEEVKEPIKFELYQNVFRLSNGDLYLGGSNWDSAEEASRTSNHRRDWVGVVKLTGKLKP